MLTRRNKNLCSFFVIDFCLLYAKERLSEEHHHHQQSSLESSIAHSDIESVDTPSCLTDVHPFFKDPAGRFLVLYSFIARDENDISVERGELVTVLNREDADWFWVQRYNGHEGFVPSAFIFPADVINSHAQSPEVSSEAQSVTTGATTTLRQEATSQKPLASSKQVDKLLDSIDFKDLTFSANNDSASAQKEYRYDTKSGTVSLHTYHNTADRAFPTTRNNLGSSEHLTSNNLNLNASTTASQWTTTPAADGAVEGDNTTNSNTLKTTPYREREGSSINNTRKSTMSQQNRNTSVGNCRLQDHNVGGNQTKDVEDGESGRTHSHHHHSSGKNSSGQDSEANGKENDSQRNGPSELLPHGAKASGQDAPHTGNDSEVASIVQSETPYRAKATEFIVMYDHETDAEYELPIQRKELVYADLNCQNADGWYWVYSPRLNEYGYVPRGFVMESRPATTSL